MGGSETSSWGKRRGGGGWMPKDSGLRGGLMAVSTEQCLPKREAAVERWHSPKRRRDAKRPAMRKEGKEWIGWWWEFVEQRRDEVDLSRLTVVARQLVGCGFSKPQTKGLKGLAVFRGPALSRAGVEVQEIQGKRGGGCFAWLTSASSASSATVAMLPSVLSTAAPRDIV